MTDKETDRVNVAPDRPCVRAESAGALLPCPFCGETVAGLMGPTCTERTPYDASHRAYPVVRCRCGAEVAGTNWDQRGHSAATAWNTRAPAVVSDNVQKMEGDSASPSSRGGTSPEVEEIEWLLDEMRHYGGLFWDKQRDIVWDGPKLANLIDRLLISRLRARPSVPEVEELERRLAAYAHLAAVRENPRQSLRAECFPDLYRLAADMLEVIVSRASTTTAEALPVAWMCVNKNGMITFETDKQSADRNERFYGCSVRPLVYAAHVAPPEEPVTDLMEALKKALGEKK